MSPLNRISESYLNILVPPPARGPDVCDVCRRATEGFRRCWQCNQHFQSHGAELADEVLPISMAVEGSQLVHVLGNYKNSKVPGVRKQFTNELAGVLATFLARHRRCLGEFDLVTVVPSTRQRAGGHPLVDILGRRLSSPALTSPKCSALLAVTTGCCGRTSTSSTPKSKAGGSC